VRRDREEEALFAGTGDGAIELPAPAAPPSRVLVILEYEDLPDPAAAGEGPGLLDRTGGGALELLESLAAQPGVLLVALKPLPADRVGEWIARRCPGLAVPPRLLQRIHEKCGGSQRLLDEMARRLGESPGSLEEGGDLEAVFRLPDNLQDAVI